MLDIWFSKINLAIAPLACFANTLMFLSPLSVSTLNEKLMTLRFNSGLMTTLLYSSDARLAK